MSFLIKEGYAMLGSLITRDELTAIFEIHCMLHGRELAFEKIREFTRTHELTRCAMEYALALELANEFRR